MNVSNAQLDRSYFLVYGVQLPGTHLSKGTEIVPVKFNLDSVEIMVGCSKHRIDPDTQVEAQIQ